MLAFEATEVSYLDAERSAREAAIDVQRQCVDKGRCPDSVPHWDIGYDQRPGTSEHLGPWAKYYAQYRVADDHRSFTIVLRHNMDNETLYSGGVEKTLAIRPDAE